MRAAISGHRARQVETRIRLLLGDLWPARAFSSGSPCVYTKFYERDARRSSLAMGAHGGRNGQLLLLRCGNGHDRRLGKSIMGHAPPVHVIDNRHVGNNRRFHISAVGRTKRSPTSKSAMLTCGPCRRDQAALDGTTPFSGPGSRPPHRREVQLRHAHELAGVLRRDRCQMPQGVVAPDFHGARSEDEHARRDVAVTNSALPAA